MNTSEQELQLDNAEAEYQLMLEVNQKLATVLHRGLQHYTMAISLLADYISTGKRSHRTNLHRYATNVGLDIAVMALVVDKMKDRWQPSDKTSVIYAPVALPLAHLLGESYIALLAVKNVEIARRCPIILPDRITELLTPAVQEWMSNYVQEDIPFAAASGK